MANAQRLFRPRGTRYGAKVATVAVQSNAPTLTDTGTTVFRIPTPYRKCRFVRGTVGVTQVPISAGGTITGTFRKHDASADHLEAIGTLAISATAEKFKTTSIAAFQFDGTRATKAATDNLVFSAAYTINSAQDSGQFWAAFLIQINAAGTVSTKVVSADQAYTTEAAAIAALPSADSGKVSLGYITLRTNVDGTWTANTDDMTAASDVDTVNVYDNTAGTIQSVALTAGVNLEAAGMITREVTKDNGTASEADALIDAKDCLEFHVVCTNSVGTQPTRLTMLAELLVLE